MAGIVGEDNVLVQEPAMTRRGLRLHAAGQARRLLPSSATATAATASCGHGGGPCMLHNAELRLQRRADPAGRHLLGAAGRGVPEEPEAARKRRMIGVGEAFAPRYAQARQKFLRGLRERGPARWSRMRIRCRAATARSWRWTWRSMATRTPSSLLIVSSACHGVEGYCGSGVQVFALHDAEWREKARDAGRGGAVRACAQSARLLARAARDARERGPEPQLPRLLASRCR